MSDILPPKPLYRKVVAALAESEDRYRLLVEGVGRYAIFMLDPKGTVLTWNRGIQELLGYEREEIVGHSGMMVFTDGDRKSRAFQRELAKAKQCSECITNRLVVRKDGTKARVHDTVTSLHDSKGVLIGYAKVTRSVGLGPTRKTPELAKALARVQVEIEHRRRLEVQLLTAVEEERERLGRDLHDDLSQRLAGISMIARAAATGKLAPRSVERETLLQIGDMLRDAIGVARDLAHGLHPVTLTRQGLPAALEELAERVPKEIDFRCPTGERLDFETSVALHVYRIAEEAVGNAVKHSEADKITIDLAIKSPKRGLLAITDNGKGFAEGGCPQGMGLQNMGYRAGVIDGKLTITSALQKGTRVQCLFPIARLGARQRATVKAPAKRRKTAK